MDAIYTRALQIAGRYFSIGLLATATFAFAQNTGPLPPPQVEPSPANPGGWKRVGEASAQAQNTPPNSYPQYGQLQSGGPNQAPAPSPQYNPPPSAYNQQNNENNPPAAAPPVPAFLNIQPGTYVTVRVNQALSSDTNQPGDAFTVTLTQPVVVNGVVVAEPGQTLGGRVVAVEKHHVGSSARLGIQLTNMTLVDGQQVPISTQFISRAGGTTPGGQEFGTVAATTGLGAAIGAAAGWGTGAAIGAGAGAAAGLIGVLVTHNHASVIYPEQMLTFRLEAPVFISTEHGQQAFRYVQPNEYDRPHDNGSGGPAPSGPGAYGPGAYGSAAPPPPPPTYYSYGYGYPYPYYGYTYGYPYWGPSFSFYYGPGFWWGSHGYHYPYYGHGWTAHGYAGGHTYKSHGVVAGGHVSGSAAVHGAPGRR
jgi:hypothetical protein